MKGEFERLFNDDKHDKKSQEAAKAAKAAFGKLKSESYGSIYKWLQAYQQELDVIDPWMKSVEIPSQVRIAPSSSFAPSLGGRSHGHSPGLRGDGTGVKLVTAIRGAKEKKIRAHEQKRYAEAMFKRANLYIRGLQNDLAEKSLKWKKEQLDEWEERLKEVPETARRKGTHTALGVNNVPTTT